MKRTYSQKPADVTRKWYIVDASEIPLGRLATKVSSIIIGKRKVTATPHVDGGDYVVVINAANAVVTGTKETNKKYYHYSQYPGGLSERSLAEQRKKDPTAIIERAVRGMVPVNKLRPGRMERLKVYSGSEHPHNGQNPEPISLKELK